MAEGLANGGKPRRNREKPLGLAFLEIKQCWHMFAYHVKCSHNEHAHCLAGPGADVLSGRTWSNEEGEVCLSPTGSKLGD